MRLWTSDHNISSSAWIFSARIWSLPGGLYLFNFTIVISTSRGLGSGTSRWAVCMCILICLTLLKALPAIRYVLVTCNQLTIFILQYVTSRLVTPFKCIILLLYMSILYLFLLFIASFLIVPFQIFSLIIPEMAACFTSYIIHITPIYFTYIL
jgi:hypothetical protein